MKLLALVGLLSSAYCTENYSQGEYENKERRVVGGGNYGGFIGLTTYPAGPFLVKGKYERDNYGRFGPDLQNGLRQSQSEYDDGQRHNDDNQKDAKKNIDNDKDKKEGDPETNEENYEEKYISNVRYEDIQNDQSFLIRPRENGKENDDYLEYLGYRGSNGYCIGEFGDNGGQRYYGYRGGSRINQGSNYDDETKERCDNLFGYTGPTANDEPENLVRPCALDDWQCIRKYFAANSNCKPAYGPIPDPLHINVNTEFYPVFNITIAVPNLRVRGLSSAKIREFYVNEKSGNLVFALDVVDLNETTPRAYVRYRRTAKESIVLADFATIKYRALTLTAVIPKVPNLRLDLADIHADIQDPAPPYFLGPGAINSTDSDVLAAFADLNLFYPIFIRESFTFKAQLFTSIYIQENICDFGLQIISV